MYYKSCLSVVAGAAFALCLAGCDKEENNDVQPDAKVALTSINVTPAQVLLNVGGTQQLTPAAVPADAADVDFKWSSANNAVATVSTTGLVTAVAVGATTVTVTSGSVKKDVPVTVNDKPLTAFTVTPTEINARLGDEAVQLTITRTPADGVGAFTYTSGDNAVATVSADGLVAFTGVGATTITVTSGDLEPQTVPVTVAAAFVPSLAVTPAAPGQVLAAGGSLEFAIAANAEWAYSLSAGADAWLTEATKTDTGLTLTVAQNATVDEKSATVTFSLTAHPEVTQAVTVSQANDAIAVLNEEDFGTGVTPTVLSATAANLKATLEDITTAGNYVVNLTENATIDANITLATSDVTISLRGSGNTISPAGDFSIVTITEGKLILRDLTLSKTGHLMPTVKVNANGELVIHDGVSIVGTGENTNAGVDVAGRFVMKGGEIHGHRRPGGGAAMYLHDAGVFQMEDGKIYNNRAEYAGGIFIMGAGAEFIMNGGEFYDNHSTNADEGGGAVYVWVNGRVEINSGATIYGKDGGDGKTGNTATSDGYGHAVTVFLDNGAAHGWFRSNTIQGEALSIIAAGGAEPQVTGSWESW
jgi:hypothetical protein